MSFTVAALYRFTPFEDPDALRGALRDACAAHGVFGTLLLAREGINGTIAGPADGIAAVLAQIRALPGCDALEVKESRAAEMPFKRLKVRVKPEIVTMGQPGVDPRAAVGRYISPADWNALISAPDVAVIDTRNDYEVEIGSFEGAIDPGTERFRDFPAWWAENQDRLAGKRIAMFCTGGIRCEKSTALLRQHGFEEVYHLRGGILKYLEEIPRSESLWEGECFVFDERVTVNHALEQGSYGQCHACRMPVTRADMASDSYSAGVSCPHCIDRVTDAQRSRFAERERQVQLAEARGQAHMGAGVAATRQANRRARQQRKQRQRALTGQKSVPSSSG